MAAALLMALLCGLALSAGLASSWPWSIGNTPTAVASGTGAIGPAPYVPHEVIVGFSDSQTNVVDLVRRATGLDVNYSKAPSGAPNARTLLLPGSVSVGTAVGQIEAVPGVTYAIPNYIAHAAGGFVPDDRGRTTTARGWEKLQWNFLSPAGVNAPPAWSTLRRHRRPGAKGVTVAVLDTGVAFRNWKTFKRSPDFRSTRFVHPCDLVVGRVKSGNCTDPYPLDRNGHGTFVAGVIAEATNNRIGLTGLAYNASVMPVRVLDAEGNGDAGTIAEGIRYAVDHHAKVVNLSIEFTPGTTMAEIPPIISAIEYAHSHNVVVVAAAGNDATGQIAYPARDSDAISVGATTRDLCLADYSNTGRGLDLVAPGGGDDASTVHSPDCHPNRNLPDVFQMTFNNPRHPDRFSLPGGWFGTSMATPEVAAAAAMVVASGVIGHNPNPTQILQQLEYTAHPLGGTPPSSNYPNRDYGYGLVDIGAALAKPATIPTTTTTTTTTTPPTTTGTGAVSPPVTEPTATIPQQTP